MKELKNCGLLTLVLLSVFALLIWRSLRSQNQWIEKIGSPDIDFRSATLASLESVLGSDHIVTSPCVVVLGQHRTTYLDCTEYNWGRGVIIGWESNFASHLSMLIVSPRFRGTLCGKTWQQSKHDGEACQLALVQVGGSLEWRDPTAKLPNSFP